MLEVGLGGRFDATNVVDRPAATAITSISMDHMEFLGDTLEKIAFEKAGIIKPGVPCATGAEAALAVLAPSRRGGGAPLLARGRDWHIDRRAMAACATPMPTGAGPAAALLPARTRPTMPASPSPRCAPGTRPG